MFGGEGVMCELGGIIREVGISELHACLRVLISNMVSRRKEIKKKTPAVFCLYDCSYGGFSLTWPSQRSPCCDEGIRVPCSFVRLE